MNKLAKRGKNLLFLFLILLVVILLYFAITELPDSEQETADETEETISISGQLNIDIEQITGLSWNYNNDVIECVETDGVWQLASDESFQVEQSIPETMCKTIQYIYATQVLENVEDLSEYGLTDPILEIKVSDMDGNTASILIGDQNQVTGDYYCMIDNSSSNSPVYVVDSGLPTAFQYGVTDLEMIEEGETTSSETNKK